MAAPPQKEYITYQQIHQLVENIVKQCATFSPNIIVAIGGGGLIPARILREHLNVPVLVVTIESYIGQQLNELLVRQWLQDSSISDIQGRRVLVVDELNDTGNTLAYVCKRLLVWKPKYLAAAVLHNKDKPKREHLPSNVQLMVGQEMPDRWIVYPWEADWHDPAMDARSPKKVRR